MSKLSLLDTPPQWYIHLRDAIYLLSEQPSYRVRIAPLQYDFDLDYLQYVYRRDQNLAELRKLLEHVVIQATPVMVLHYPDGIPTPSSCWHPGGTVVKQGFDDWSELGILKVQYAIDEYQLRNYPELFSNAIPTLPGATSFTATLQEQFYPYVLERCYTGTRAGG